MTNSRSQTLRLGEAGSDLDLELHWLEAGEGPPLVLLHGLSDSHRTWRRVLPQLVRHFRVYAPDLPGFGLSGRPDAAYDLPWHTRVIGAWLDALDLRDAGVVGHSYGGGVAQYLLLEHGHRIDRVALVASGGLGRGVSPLLRALSIPLPNQLVQPFMKVGTRVGVSIVGRRAFDRHDRTWLSRANGLPGSARAFVRTVRGVIDSKGQSVHFLDHAHHLEDLPPVHLFWGDRDPVIPVSHGERASALLGGAPLTRFDGVGHFPQLEVPERFGTALLAYLGREDAPNAKVCPIALAQHQAKRELAAQRRGRRVRAITALTA